MKSIEQVRAALGVLECRIVEEEDGLSTAQYAILCGMLAALAWMAGQEEGRYLQALLDGDPIMPGVTDQEAEAIRKVARDVFNPASMN
jgi:hypothetical protein